jgi:hypothetical protein
VDPLTREKLLAELHRELSALERLFADYVIVTRVFINPDGTEGERITRGAFRRSPESHEERNAK